MDFCYTVFAETLCSPDTGPYRAFGIQCRSPGGDILAQISDVSTERSFVERLAQACTQGGLAPVHLMDVVCDAIL